MLRFRAISYGGRDKELWAYRRPKHKLRKNNGRNGIIYPPSRIAMTVNEEMNCKPQDLKEVHILGLDGMNCTLQLNIFKNVDTLRFEKGRVNIRKILFVKYTPLKVIGLPKVKGFKYGQFSPYTEIEGYEEMVTREKPASFVFTFDQMFREL